MKRTYLSMTSGIARINLTEENLDHVVTYMVDLVTKVSMNCCLCNNEIRWSNYSVYIVSVTTPIISSIYCQIK